MNQELVNEMQAVGSEVLARLTADAISTFKANLKVPRRWKKQLTQEFASVVMSYYYQIEIIEPLLVMAEEDEDADDEY